MGVVAYLQPAEYATYGIPDATAAQVGSASLIINSYLKRPEGLIWSPDANGMPAWMTSLNPTISYTAPAAISPGANVQVVTIPNAQFGFQTVGEVVILDRANPSLAEACVVLSTTGSTLTLQSVQFSHAADATVDFGMTIMDEKQLPYNRPITRTSRTPVARVISGFGRYGYGRRGQQAAGIEFIPTLLPIVQGFGGPPLWVPFDVSAIDINMNTGEMWVPAGLLLAYFSDVRLRYVAGWSYATLPTDIKQATASIVRGQIDTPFSANMKIIKAGDAMMQRFFAPESPGCGHQVAASWSPTRRLVELCPRMAVLLYPRTNSFCHRRQNQNTTVGSQPYSGVAGNERNDRSPPVSRRTSNPTGRAPNHRPAFPATPLARASGRSSSRPPSAWCRQTTSSPTISATATRSFRQTGDRWSRPAAHRFCRTDMADLSGHRTSPCLDHHPDASIPTAPPRPPSPANRARSIGAGPFRPTSMPT